MLKTSIFGIADTRDQADQIIHCLKVAGFSSNDLSALFPDIEPRLDFTREVGMPKLRRTHPPLLARSAWWAARRIGFPIIGSLSIPEIGSFVAVGPMILELGGAAIGSIAGRLVGMGVPGCEARHYESLIKAGKILLSVRIENREEMEQAKNIFITAGAQEICTTSRGPSLGNNLPAGARHIPPRRPRVQSRRPALTLAGAAETKPCG
jgi:hypothetical protein